VQKSVLLGMMAEIAMKAKMLREKLKNKPESVFEILVETERLEEEMVLCLFEFEKTR
jgi:hypothetical protein